MRDYYEETITETGTKTRSYTVNATASRNIVTADVLDYDGYNGNYALIWKKITISHSQSQIDSVASNNPDFDYCNGPWCDEAWTWRLTYTDDKKFNSTSTRKVEFYLTYKVNGTITHKLLCTCNMEAVDSLINSATSHSQTFSGERVWGCSIQVNADFIVYQFRKEVPVDGASRTWGGGYDGNLSFEGWIEKDDVDLWKLKSHVVGLINISDGVNSEVGYLKEEEYDVGEEGNMLSSTEIYSVGVINK
jgi:hypothetical protein